jgi:hypothetical protein
MGAGKGQSRRAHARRAEAKFLPGSWVNGATGSVLTDAGSRFMCDIENVVGVGATVKKRFMQDAVAALYVVVRKGTKRPDYQSLPRSITVKVDGQNYNVPVVIAYRKDIVIR